MQRGRRGEAPVRRTTQSKSRTEHVELHVHRGEGAAYRELLVRVPVDVEETRSDGINAGAGPVGFTEDGEQVPLTLSEQRKAENDAVDLVMR